MTRHLPLITVSSLKAYRRCPRLYRLRYLDGYRSAADEAEALRFGTLVHRGLEAWFRAAQQGVDGDDRLARCLAALTADGGAVDPFDLARATELLTGYHYRWEAEPLEVLAVEAEFRAPLINPDTGAPSRTWRLGGKLDAIVRTVDGRVLIVEHKTSSSDITTGSDYWRQLRMDGQVSAYYVGAAALGYDVAGCLYDVLAKPASKPLKATPPEVRKYTKTGALYANQRDTDEAPGEYQARLREAIATEPHRYYARGEVVRLDAEMAEHRADVWQVAHTIRAGQVRGVAPRNPDACMAFNRCCEYWPVCTGEASLDDAGRYRRVENVHPELAPDEAPLPKEEASDHGNNDIPAT